MRVKQGVTGRSVRNNTSMRGLVIMLLSVLNLIDMFHHADQPPQLGYNPENLPLTRQSECFYTQSEPILIFTKQSFPPQVFP